MPEKEIGSYILVDKNHLFEIIDGCSSYATSEDRLCANCEFDKICEKAWGDAERVGQQRNLEIKSGVR